MRSVLIPVAAGLLSFFLTLVTLYVVTGFFYSLVTESIVWLLPLASYAIALVTCGYVCGRLTDSAWLHRKLLLAGSSGALGVFLASFIVSGESNVWWLFGVFMVTGATLSIVGALISWQLRSAN